MEWVALEITPGDCWIPSPGAAFLAGPLDSAHYPLLLCLVDSGCLERALGVPALARYRPAALNPATEPEWVPSEHGFSPAVVFPVPPHRSGTRKTSTDCRSGTVIRPTSVMAIRADKPG